MRRLIPFLIIYVIVHAVDGDSARTYVGQPQATITSLLASEGKTGDFVTQQAYDAFVLTQIPVPPTPAQVLAALRSGALDQLTDGSSNSKVIRAVFLVELDEINTIRGLLVPPQPPRTIQQFKTAVQNKINSGSAD